MMCLGFLTNHPSKKIRKPRRPFSMSSPSSQKKSVAADEDKKFNVWSQQWICWQTAISWAVEDVQIQKRTVLAVIGVKQRLKATRRWRLIWPTTAGHHGGADLPTLPSHLLGYNENTPQPVRKDNPHPGPGYCSWKGRSRHKLGRFNPWTECATAKGHPQTANTTQRNDTESREVELWWRTSSACLPGGSLENKGSASTRESTKRGKWQNWTSC